MEESAVSHVAREGLYVCVDTSALRVLSFVAFHAASAVVSFHVDRYLPSSGTFQVFP